MKAKLKVLRALYATTREFLLLDEPTAGLDVSSARGSVLDLSPENIWRKMERGRILISSHISTDLEGLCDDIYMIHEGQDCAFMRIPTYC